MKKKEFPSSPREKFKIIATKKLSKLLFFEFYFFYLRVAVKASFFYELFWKRNFVLVHREKMHQNYLIALISRKKIC